MSGGRETAGSGLVVGRLNADVVTDVPPLQMGNQMTNSDFSSTGRKAHDFFQVVGRWKVKSNGQPFGVMRRQDLEHQAKLRALKRGLRVVTCNWGEKPGDSLHPVVMGPLPGRTFSTS